VRLESEHFASFVPADPPRVGALAVWGDGQGSDELDLVLPVGGGMRRRRVRGRLLPLASALPALLAPAAGGASASVAAWSAAAATGVGLVARGRLLPAASPDGYGAWRVGPLDAADLDWLRRIAAAMPPQGHALPVDARRPLRLRSPEGLVRELWDAIADTLVRTPAAVHATGARAFAAAEPVAVGELAGWLAETDRGLDAGAQVQLRIELPVKEEEPFAAVVQVRSVADPSLVVDAAELWSAPAAVLARLGERAETDLLLALRRGARAWLPLAPLLRSAAPTEVSLDEEQVAGLLETGAEALGGAGIEVLWPAELLGEGLDVRATVATPTPAGAAAPVFRLEALLSFDWQVTVGGEALTAEEVAALAEAKRPLVRLRGRWVRVNRELLERLRRRRGPRITAAEALTAALTGSLVVDGERVEFHAAGALVDLVDRLAGAGRAAVEPPEGLRATLRPYQGRGLSWLAQMSELGLGGCLADDMGLGKTVQVIALHLHRRPLEVGPTLVVCPTSLLGNWERELARFAPDVPVRRYHGGDRHLEELAADEVVLVTYGVVRRDRAVLAEVGWGLVVADEVQHAKNPLSRTARELRAIPAPARVALTGTPVENRLTELWSILDWTTPGLLGPLERFRRSVAVPVERYRDADATERLARVVRPFLLRRRKSDPRIAPELPAKTETDRVVPLTAEQATLYEAVVRETLAKIAASEGIERRGLVLVLLTALKQICNHPAQYLHEPGPLPGRSGKLTALDELLDVILAEGEAALVFSQYVEMCGLIRAHLADRGVPTLFLHGRVPARRREEMVARFQDSAAPVFLLSLKAGGVGLNLTRATHVLHYDRWWNPAVEDQATDRAYRIGQERPVQVHRLVTEGTLEDRIATLLASKRGLAEAVVGAGEAWITELSDAELAELVSLQRPS
jgi:SNF2-related domain/SNF2 Helicase protein/Helicase conserved C-terminal domain